MALQFVTGNEGKVREARTYLGEETVEPFDYDYTEIQSDSLDAIVRAGAIDAFEATPGDDPVLVDDTGLFVDALGGFPGPYSAYVEETLGIDRVWNLASREENRRARFRTVIGYTDGEAVHTFEGEVAGTLVAPRGEGGFGYDPIFEYTGKTLAEMSTEAKNAISHRGRALEAFTDWYLDDR